MSQHKRLPQQNCSGDTFWYPSNTTNTMRNRFLLGVTTLMLTVLVAGPSLSSPQSTQDDEKNIYVLTKLHRISLSMSRGEWNVLQTSSAGAFGGARGGAGDAGTD